MGTAPQLSGGSTLLLLVELHSYFLIVSEENHGSRIN